MVARFVGLAVCLIATTASAQEVSFALTGNFVAGATPLSVAIGDFNGDGIPDVVVTNYVTDGTIAVLLANRDGSLQPPRIFAVGNLPSSVAVGDFNRDGSLDLVVANSGSQDVSVLLGNGDGTFQAARNFPAGNGPASVAVGDFDSDGQLDLAVANRNSNSVSVLLGYGDGSFRPPRDFGVGSHPSSITIADFDGDGSLDFATANNGSSNVSIRLGNGDGAFQPNRTFAARNGPVSIKARDFNGDGWQDLVVANQNSSDLSVLLGNGNGTFRPARAFAVGSFPWSVEVGDFNGDGLPDFVVASSGSNDVSILLGDGDGGFELVLSLAAESEPVAVAVGDFNGDGLPDLAVANQASNTVSVLVNTTQVQVSFQPARNFSAGSVPFSITIGDFDSDGLPDVAVANYLSSGTVSILRGNGDGTLEPPRIYSVGSFPFGICVGDFNGDGLPDLGVANSGSATISVLLGNRNGTFQPARDFEAGAGPVSIAAADFNGDGWLDVVVANLNSDAISVLLGDGNGNFLSPINFPTGAEPSSVAVGDFNQDGWTDVVVANSQSASMSVLLGNGDGTLQLSETLPTGNVPVSIAVGDFNGDGTEDVAVANQDSNDVSVFLGNGDGSFLPVATLRVGRSPRSVVVGDFNRDGAQDLAVANSLSNDISILLGNGDGSFRRRRSFPAGSAPVALAAADFNVDGWLDLVVANRDSNNVSVLLNDPTGLVSIAVTPSNPPPLPIGATQQFTATGTLRGGRTVDLTRSATWTSSSPAVASIDASGVATGLTGGTTTIRATSGSIIGAAELRVVVVSLVSIAVTPANQMIGIGATLQFTATGTYSDQSTRDLTGSVTWISDSPSVATISTSGLATGIAPGATTIRARSGTIEGTTPLTVRGLISITVDPSSATVLVSDVQQFTATGHLSDGSALDITQSVTWISDTPSVATITTLGLARGVGAGMSTIRARSGSLEGTASISVTGPTSVVVTPSSASIPLGGAQQFTATGTFPGGPTRDLTEFVGWSSTVTTVATVNPSGRATGLAYGGTIIRATFRATPADIVGSAGLTVGLTSLALTPANPAIPAVNGTQQFTATGTFGDAQQRNVTTFVGWSSSAAAVATIDGGGLATGRALGGTMIQAASGNITASTGLTVGLVSIAITPLTASIRVSQTQPFTATGIFTSGPPQNVTLFVAWSSSNTAVATINASGVATGVAAGMTMIGARSGTISAPVATLTVTP